MARQISGAQWNYLRCIHTDGYDSRYRKNIRTALWAKREGLVEFRKVGLGGRLFLTEAGLRRVEEAV